jgi:hypothetical protein
MKTWIGLAYALAAVAIIAVMAGCNPFLRAESPAPPGRTARLDEVHGFWGIKSYRMELTQGVALAMSCYYGGPCEKMSVTSDNPEVAEVRPASLGVLERNGIANNATASAVVVVGKAPGTTRLHLHAKEGDREIVVTTVEASARSQTAAK